MATGYWGSDLSQGYSNYATSTNGYGSSYANYAKTYMEQRHENNVFAQTLSNEDESKTLILNEDADNFIYQIESQQEDEAAAAFNALLEDMANMPEYASLVKINEDGTKDYRAIRPKATQIVIQALAERDGKEPNEIDLEKWLEKNTANVSEQHCQYNSTWNDSIVDETTTEDLIYLMTGREVKKEGGNSYHFGDGCRNVFASFHNWLWGRESF